MDQEDNCAAGACINGFTKPTVVFSFKGLAWLKESRRDVAEGRYLKFSNIDDLLEELDAEDL